MGQGVGDERSARLSVRNRSPSGYDRAEPRCRFRVVTGSSVAVRRVTGIRIYLSGSGLS